MRTMTNAPAKRQPLGLQLVEAGRDTFTEMIAIEHEGQNAQRALARWEVGIRQRVFRTPDLAKCDTGQVLAALVEACQWGFESAPASRHFSLVPYGKDCQMIPSMQGLMHVAEQSEQVEEIRFGVLHRCDAERIQKGEAPPLFDPKTKEPQVEDQLIDDDEDRSDDAIVGAWVGVKLVGKNQWRTLYLRRSDIERHRNASKAPNSPAWKSWYRDMAIKTVVKKLLKSGRIPMGRHTALATRSDDEEFVQADVESISDTPDLELLEAEAHEAMPDNLTRDEIEEDIARLEDAVGLSPDQTKEYAIETYGSDPNEMSLPLLWKLSQDVSIGLVQEWAGMQDDFDSIVPKTAGNVVEGMA